MIDLAFADAKTAKAYDCNRCAASTKKLRNCMGDGFENMKVAKSMGMNGLPLRFCPSKATWYPEIIDLYDECLIAYKTSLLPQEGGLESQSVLFNSVFGFFVTYYDKRQYAQIWSDVSDFTGKVFEAISKMFGGK